MVAFCGATLESGIEIVMDVVGLRAKVAGANVVFVAEGRLDAQTAYGKTPAGVARLAQEAGAPVLAIGGSVSPEARVLHDRGVAALRSTVNEPMSLEEAMAPERASALIAFAAEEVLRAFLAGRVSASQTPSIG